MVSGYEDFAVANEVLLKKVLDYHKKNGEPVYTGEGVFTIVKVKDGQGAKLWGLLKSYADDENGWIALDSDYGTKI